MPMKRAGVAAGRDLVQTRLFMEELCCDLCRFLHIKDDKLQPENVRIDREYPLGVPDAFADIRVAPKGQAPYFLEVKLGYSASILLDRMCAKYQRESAATRDATRLILLTDATSDADWPALESRLRASIRPDLKLEVWDEQRLRALVAAEFGVQIKHMAAESLLEVQHAIDRAKGFRAFGAVSIEAYDHDVLKAQLLWHFGMWRLRQLRLQGRSDPREIFPPGRYRRVVVLLADLCGFSSYVRDTQDDAVIRDNLTTFYSRARYLIINGGGLLDKFVGDQAVGLFGVPVGERGFVDAALDAAKGLLAVGMSVSRSWQNNIDRIQTVRGVHIGMAIGDLETVSLRPFSRTHIGVVGDALNTAARLQSSAGPGEIVISNALRSELEADSRRDFQEMEPVEAKNVGLIRAWRLPAAGVP